MGKKVSQDIIQT